MTKEQIESIAKETKAYIDEKIKALDVAHATTIEEIQKRHDDKVATIEKQHADNVDTLKKSVADLRLELKEVNIEVKYLKEYRPKDGKDGKDGASIKGEKGDRGGKGADGEALNFTGAYDDDKSYKCLDVVMKSNNSWVKNSDSDKPFPDGWRIIAKGIQGKRGEKGSTGDFAEANQEVFDEIGDRLLMLENKKG